MTIDPPDVLAAMCRQHFAAFVAKAFNVLNAGSNQRFLPAWHVNAMCEAMDEAVFGERRRLVITVPPRHLKSFCAAVALPAFVLGHRPGTRIMVANYALDVGRDHARLCRQLMTSPWYQALFPAARNASCSGDHLRTTAGGDRFTVSVGGSVTGFAAQLIVIDDALNASDAASPAERLRVQTFIDNSLLTRFNDPQHGTVIAIQQRLHEEDPAGYLLAKGYRHLNLPAIATERVTITIGMGKFITREINDPLFPARFGTAVLEERRRELGTAVFNMQFQQDPVAAGGSPLRWEWFGTYDTPEPRYWYQYVVQSWDTAMSGDPRADFSVCTTWGFREGIWYLLDVFRDRLDYPPLRNKVQHLYRQWIPDLVIIEDAGTGRTLLQEIWRDEALRSSFRRGWSPESKEVRFQKVQAVAEAGEIALPRDAPWLQSFRQEMLGFPRARYDDQVDSVSQFAEWIRIPRSEARVREAARQHDNR